MRAILSGATRGIGRAIAVELAKKGYHLILIARKEIDLKSLLAEIGTDSSQHEYIAMDLSDANQFQKLDDCIKKIDNIDLIINNLGFFEMDSPSKLELDVLQKLMEVNVFSAIKLTQYVLPSLQKSPSSKIINIGSIHALQANTNSISYSISKHALKAWTDGLREELRSKNIGVSNILPAAVNTSSWDGITVNRNEMIQAEDIAKLICTLVDLSPNCLVEEIKLSPINFQN